MEYILGSNQVSFIKITKVHTSRMIWNYEHNYSLNCIQFSPISNYCIKLKKSFRTSFEGQKVIKKSYINPLSPVPAVNGHNECTPLFHFWHHHLWSKLASSILKFCRWKRSFQWYPDQSDLLHGAWNMQENAQKYLEWKTQIYQNFLPLL